MLTFGWGVQQSDGWFPSSYFIFHTYHTKLQRRKEIIIFHFLSTKLIEQTFDLIIIIQKKIENRKTHKQQLLECHY